MFCELRQPRLQQQLQQQKLMSRWWSRPASCSVCVSVTVLMYVCVGARITECVSAQYEERWAWLSVKHRTGGAFVSFHSRIRENIEHLYVHKFLLTKQIKRLALSWLELYATLCAVHKSMFETHSTSTEMEFLLCCCSRLKSFSHLSSIWFHSIRTRMILSEIPLICPAECWSPLQRRCGEFSIRLKIGNLLGIPRNVGHFGRSLKNTRISFPPMGPLPNQWRVFTARNPINSFRAESIKRTQFVGQDREIEREHPNIPKHNLWSIITIMMAGRRWCSSHRTWVDFWCVLFAPSHQNIFFDILLMKFSLVLIF